MPTKTAPKQLALSSVNHVVTALMINDKPTIARTARELKMSSRTLHRRLHQVGTTYSQVLDHCRLRMARHLLKASDARMYEIAVTTGYSDPSSFSRAFLRWTGQTPKQFRGSSKAERCSPRR